MSGMALATPAELARRLERLGQAQAALNQELTRGQQRLKELARSAWRVEEEERKRLARELHDGLGQTLSALKNELTRLGLSEPELAGSLADALALSAQALADTRELARLLRPPMLDDLGLAAALRWLLRHFGERSGARTELVLEGLEPGGEPDRETLVFRIAQEALNNAEKHARAGRVRLDAGVAAGWLWLNIQDDGQGFDPSDVQAGGQGFGLAAMRDRADLFGGRIAIEAAPGAGCTIRLELPWPTPTRSTP